MVNLILRGLMALTAVVWVVSTAGVVFGGDELSRYLQIWAVIITTAYFVRGAFQDYR